MMKKLVLYIVICAVTAATAVAQPYSQDIAAFRKQDSVSFPGTGKILFVGSSSFTNWKDVQQYFPAYPVINRGFGGSSLPDVIRYESQVIFPYKPKQVVIYCGENDIAGDTAVTGKTVFARFKQLYQDIRDSLGNVPLVYISMKPSPSRWHMWERMMEGNKLIRAFLKKKKRNAVFIDVWPSMLGTDGKPVEDLFISDKLHMNSKGYTIWQKLIEPHLLK